MKLNTESILRSGAAALFAGGIIWTAVNLLQADVFFEKMRGKQESIIKLREIKQENDLIESSFAALAALSNAAPPLSATASAVTGTVAEIRELDPRALGRGWNVKRVEIKFSEVNLNSIAGFLRTAETGYPPWRLVECVIVSSPKADAWGAVTLTMETVTRTDR